MPRGDRRDAIPGKEGVQVIEPVPGLFDIPRSRGSVVRPKILGDFLVPDAVCAVEHGLSRRDAPLPLLEDPSCLTLLSVRVLSRC